MPNIGAFIAWGLLTALFIPVGWWPNESLAKLITPMLSYLLPLLIAYTGGRNVGGERGGVAGAIAAMGVIVGSEIPMFIGAMLMGPLAGYLLLHFDRWIEGRTKAGFEMLVNNFSVGIIGLLLAIVGFLLIGDAVSILTAMLAAGAEWVMQHSILPVAALFVEPAKVLFLNNAINHGILTPVGIEQARETGQSILFLLETNPGPGLGVLIAYWLFGAGSSRQSAPGAIAIQFLGGIHEIYFPYVLARPALILAPITGSAAGILFFSLFDAGLVAPASPGSILAVLAMAAKGKTLLVVMGVAISALVSLLISIPFIRRREDVKQQIIEPVSIFHVDHILFACDAGLGSSVLGATRFRERIRKVGITDVQVTNCAIDAIPCTASIIVCQRALAARAIHKASQAQVVVIENFLNDPALDALMVGLEKRHSAVANEEVLRMENIQIGLASESKTEAIRRAGQLLVAGGYVQTGYVAAMLDRERITTTYMGMGIAIPHGTAAAKEAVLRSGIVVLQYPEGVYFDDEKAHLVIGIAGVGDTHLDLLARLSTVLDDEQTLQQLFSTDRATEIYELLK